jgi:hypothetical protein
VAGHLGARGARQLPLVVMLAGGLALLVLGWWLARRAVLDAPWMRADGMNLEATRSEDVRVWLCAHLDSKSQPIPTLVRSAGIVVEGIGFLATLALAVAAAAGRPAPFAAWVLTAIVTLVGAFPVVLSVVGSRSPGAFDNASGVVTVLAAARDLADRDDVGVLLSDAEELGLAGAHAWGRNRGGAVVLNCDGVDDHGAVQVMYAGRAPVALLGAVREASRACGVATRVRRLPLGVLTDSVAIAQGGGMSVTFSRGTLASLARVHSVRDDLSRLRGAGIAETARAMAAAARTLASRTTPNGRET